MFQDFFLGFVKIHILYHASKAPIYGVEILEELARHGYRLSPGTLYPTLHALLKERDVTVSNETVKGKVRKCYRATAKGRKELSEVTERLSVLMRRIF